MNPKRALVLIVVVVAVLMVLSSGIYILGETEQVIITQFGEPVGDPVTQPGLHFKIPFIPVVSQR